MIMQIICLYNNILDKQQPISKTKMPKLPIHSQSRSPFPLVPLLLFLMVPLVVTQFNPSSCSNYYSSSSPPPSCSNFTCTFQVGLNQLIANSTDAQHQFVLCLDLPNYWLYINQAQGNNTFVEAIASLYIYAENVYMDKAYSLVCQRNLVIITQNYSQFQSVTLSGQKIWIKSYGQISINGSRFINESVAQTQCNCLTHDKPCDWTFEYPHLFNTTDSFNVSTFDIQLNYSSPPNNSITISANNLISVNSSQIHYSVIGLFSQYINIGNSALSTTGLGYPSDSGPGCGYFDQVLNQLLGCMGSGGSHGGFGGNSSPQNCYLLVSKQPYDRIDFPREPGSGGGFFLPHSRQSSSGGGVINMQALNISLQQNFITSDGKNGIQGGGGGAGGTISLDYNTLSATGYLTTISANGGNGDKMSSSGSGGRIRLWNHNWKYQYNKSPPNLSVSVAGGLGCIKTVEYNFTIDLSCGQSGSVFTSPCRPGTNLSLPSYICTPCQQGSYQLNYGYSKCIPCSPKPQNSQWTQYNVSQAQPLYYFNSCNYDCMPGFNNSYLGKCLSSSQYYFEKYNIWNIFISFGMIGVAIAIYLLIKFIKKLTQQQRILSFDDPSLNQAFRKKFFRLEDLPYHQMRLYFSGENHPYNPWCIPQIAQNSLYAQLRNPLTRISNTLARLIKQINKKSQFSRWQKIFILGLRYTYYPSSRIVLSSMRKQKAREIFDEVNKYNNRIPESQLLGIKFHVKPQQTVASLEIFNYSKSVLDFYIQNYFPLYILLQKSPFGGHIIDFSDPFLKVFINEIVQKQAVGKSVENFLRQSNKFLKNQARILSCLNHLWTLSDINQKFQAFLWQPTNEILGIDRKYKINKKQQLFLVISSENLDNNHFLLNQRLPYTYLPEIQSLKHKFNVRKDLASEEDGNSIWIINNQVSEKVLLWIFGTLTCILLLLTLATFFINLLIISGKMDSLGCDGGFQTFNYGFVIYFALWPLCDFATTFLNFKAILSKDQYILADSISFNIFTVIKSLILFISVLVKIIQENKSCLQPVEYIWLTMIIIGIIIFIVQIMLRARIIALTK